MTLAQASVFIIESPGEAEARQNRAEGRALSEALNLAGTPCHYHQVSTAAELAQAIGRFVDHFDVLKVAPGSTTVVPFLHFSAHGRPGGVYTTNGDSVSWKELHGMFLSVLAEVDLHVDTYPIQMAFSTCWGYAASALYDFGPPYPSRTITGPKDKVGWSDSLTAFIVFYHSVVNKQFGIHRAIELMNSVVGNDTLFAFKPAPNNRRHS